MTRLPPTIPKQGADQGGELADALKAVRDGRWYRVKERFFSSIRMSMAVRVSRERYFPTAFRGLGREASGVGRGGLPLKL